MMPWARAATIAALMLLAEPGFAQVPVQQDGRLFDANPSLDGLRYNYSRPVSPLMSGNPFATGNVRYGQALQSFSPIPSTTAFRGPLGSGMLSDFIRDSVSVLDQRVALDGWSAGVFYDPSTNVPTVGYLRGQGPFTPQPTFGPPVAPTRPRTLPGLLNYSVPLRTSPLASEVDRFSSEPAGPLPRELSSSLFGVQTLGIPGPASFEPVRSKPFQAPSASDVAAQAEAASQRPADLRPLDFSLRPQPPFGPTSEPLARPLDALLGEGPAQLVFERGPRPLSALGETLPPVVGPGIATTEGAASPAASPETGRLAIVDESLLPGHDVFTDMQLALALQNDPRAEWFEMMQQAVRESPELAQRRSELLELESQEFVQRVLATPLHSLAAGAPTPFNDRMLEAETLLAQGRYYDALRRYEQAAALEPANPLPLIGAAHAHLAAGQYLSAALFLVRGLERFPDLARFQVDLAALMGGGEIVDIRRADIMKRLERNEDPQLRFLLGYLEYHAGLREFGLKNLERAADEAPPGSMMARYPRLLREGPRPAAPPPAMEPSDTDQPPKAADPPAAAQPSEGVRR